MFAFYLQIIGLRDYSTKYLLALPKKMNTECYQCNHFEKLFNELLLSHQINFQVKSISSKTFFPLSKEKKTFQSNSSIRNRNVI